MGRGRFSDFSAEGFAEFGASETVVVAEVVDERRPFGGVDVALVENEVAGGVDAEDFDFRGDRLRRFVRAFHRTANAWR